MEQELLRLTTRVIELENILKKELDVIQKKSSEHGANIAGLNSLQGKLLKDLEASNARIYALEKSKEVEYAVALEQRRQDRINAEKPIEKPKSWWERFK